MAQDPYFNPNAPNQDLANAANAAANAPVKAPAGSTGIAGSNTAFTDYSKMPLQAPGFSTVTAQGLAYATPGQPAKEQTIMTSDQSQQVSNLKNNVSSGIAGTGIRTDANGNPMYANGTQYASPTEGTATSAATDEAALATGRVSSTLSADPNSLNYNMQYANLHPELAPETISNTQTILDNKAKSDAAGANMMDAISSMYGSLIQQQKTSNASAEAQRSQSLLMSGSSRYAQESSIGVMNAQISYGLQQVSSLIDKENYALAQAQDAINKQDYQYAEKLIAIKDKAQADRMTVTKNIIDNLQKVKDKQNADLLQSNKDQAIASLFSAGTVDPADILSDPSAKALGINAKDISGVLDTISKNTGVDTKQLTGSVKDFYVLQKSNDLPSNILALPPEQQLSAYLKMVGDASRAAPKPAPITGSTAPVGTSVTSDAQDVLEGRNTLFNIRQTMGRSNQAASYMTDLRNAIRGKDPKFDFVASDAGAKFYSSTYAQKSLASIDNVLPDLKIAEDLSSKIPRIGIKGVDALIQNGATQIGNKTVTNFHQARNLLADSIGIALGQGGVSDMKLQLGFDITDPSVTDENFASNLGLVEQFLQNRKQGINDQRYKSSATDSPVTATTHNGINLPGSADIVSPNLFNGIKLPN